MNLFELFVKIGVDDQASDKLENITKKLGDGLKKAAKIGMSAIAGLTTFSIKAFAEYEQLVGGVETLFKGSSDTVKEYAQNAYKTAGMSANEYMSTVTSFSASLLQSFKDTSGEVTEEMAEDMIDSLDKQVDAFEEATDKQIKLINKQYTESMKLIDEEEYRRLKAIDDQIAAIENQQKAEENAKAKRQQEERKAELQRLVDLASDDENRMKAQKMLSDYVQELSEKELKEERKNQISQLKDQKEAIKEETDLRRDALKEQHDYELEAYKEARSKELKELKKYLAEQEKTIKESIGTSSKMVSLPAEAYEKTAEAANMAITDMADNANKFGSSMESLQMAYAGFSKQNYTMLKGYLAA